MKGGSGVRPATEGRGSEGPGRKGPLVLSVSLPAAFTGSVRRCGCPGQGWLLPSRSAKRQLVNAARRSSTDNLNAGTEHGHGKDP